MLASENSGKTEHGKTEGGREITTMVTLHKQTAKAMAAVICLAVIFVILILRDFRDFQLWPISVISVIFRATDMRETLQGATA